MQKGQRLGSGYKWLAGLVSRVCMATRVSLQGLQGGGGSEYFGVQISRDRPHLAMPTNFVRYL